MQRTWSLPQTSGRAEQIVQSLALSPAVAEILVQRGIERADDAVDFLRPTLFNLPSPFCFQAMSRAVERITRAWQTQEKILVYGDYDVDGVTSAALLYRVLTDLGFKALVYIPHRLEEGYGLHREAIDRASEAGVGVIVTVDCGISAAEEVHYAGELGIDVIVTDHHEPAGSIPEAWAILNPKLDEAYPFRDLAGVGVAFKLAQALLATFRESRGQAGSRRGRENESPGARELRQGLDSDLGPEAEKELLDFVALGTIADVVPLLGENRIFVHYGLEQIRNSTHTGVRALLKECGLENKPLKAGQIAFIMAPKINAAGRMDSARAGLELLITANEEKAEELARFLNLENQKRQETEKKILEEAVAELEKGPIPRVIVLASSGWHHGVIGIVASRLVERYYRPAFLIAVEGEEGRGSARGIPGYHVLEELTGQAYLLDKFGGHRQAAGFSLAQKNIATLSRELNRSAEPFPAELYQENLTIDGRVTLADLDEDLLRDLEQLAPFGFGNPGPLLAAFDVPVARVKCVGKEGAHLKLQLGNAGSWEGIAFRQGERLEELARVNLADVAFSLEMNTFQGQKKLQLVVQDIQAKAETRVRKLSRADGSLTLGSVSNREDAAGLDPTTVSVSAPPEGGGAALAESSDLNGIREELGFWERAELVTIFRELQSAAKEQNPFLWGDKAPDGRCLNALRVFEELGFLRCLGGTNPWVIEFLPVQGKFELQASLRYHSAEKRWENVLKLRRELRQEQIPAR